MNSVEDLDVFNWLINWALKTYSATKTFPREEAPNLEIKRGGRRARWGAGHEELLSRLFRRINLATTCRRIVNEPLLGQLNLDLLA